MTAILLPISSDDHADGCEQSEESLARNERMQIVVHIQAEVIDIEVAKHKANAWLLEHVGNFLGATTSELLLGERLLWRFDVILGLPNEAQPGSGALYRIGQITLDANTGEIQNASELAQELLMQMREVR